ncbi:hypothetical protein [Mycetocola sp. 2940]|uniref:hypothetical protein n=1 Tax=Mycetocola sp. 2940 TaxID=3156452 RepID=UPI0033953A75
MSNTTPGFSDANRDGTEPPADSAPAANEAAPRDDEHRVEEARNEDITETREYDAPLTPAVPADDDSARRSEHEDAAAAVSEEFDPNAFRDSVPLDESHNESAESVAPHSDRTPAEPAAPVHHHTPEIADQAYAGPVDTHVLSSSEPTVLTQADLEADKVLAEESSADRSGVYTDTTAPVVPAPAQERTEPVAPAPVRQPVYVQAPSEPKPKSNRGFGILVSLLATVTFAVLYAAVLALLLVINDGSVNTVTDVLVKAPFWVPVIFFFIGMVLLVTIVNRGGWWAYVLGGFVVAALVYGSYLGGLLIEQAANISPSEVGGVVQRALLSPAAVVAFVLAREVPIWFGAWAASRGRKVTERNREARAEYQRVLDQGPVLS